jgi:hypothetical protein
MTMTANSVVALCEQGAYYIREDLNLAESGKLKFQMMGVDVTDEYIARMKSVLSRLQDIVDGCGCNCV